MKKYIAELFGTFVLVFMGCGSVIFSAATVGQLGIALAFGLAVTAMAYTIGSVSGAHLNPAVTCGMLVAKRISLKDACGYIVAQFLGGIVASLVLWSIAAGHITGYSVAYDGLGQNGWGATYGMGYDIISAIVFELIATFIFVKVILRATKQPSEVAGIVIGLTLALIHIVGIQITGVSVNPARSLAPALFVGGLALEQVWLFLVVPTVGGILAGLCARFCPCCK